jgi:hypothetical protein
MGQRTTVNPPRNPPRTTQTANEPAVPPVAAAPDLTISKVFAVAGAGATSAVLGSLFGVAGTVLGAAIGAVLTTVATSLYQRSLERARTAVTSRLRPQNPEVGDLDTVILAPPVRPGEQATELIAPADLPARSRKRVIGYVLATVLGFGIALGLVTGVEALKGSTLLRGETGTSVGRVLQGGPTETTTAPAEPSDPSDDDDPRGGRSQYDHNSGGDFTDPGESTEPTTRPSRTPAPSSTPEPEPTGGLGDLLGGGSNGGANGGANGGSGGGGTGGTG